LLPPGAWHRYRPDPKTGWTENWIELRGPAVAAWLAAGIFDTTPLDMRDHAGFWKWFAELHSLCREHAQGYRAIAAGIGMTLLASTMARANSVSDEAAAMNHMVRKARELLLKGTGVALIAETLGVSYPTLYRHFKRATGLAPKEYARELRLAQAEDLLSSSSLSIKEIAARLGYYSASHFSLEFRRSRKTAPASWPGRGPLWSSPGSPRNLKPIELKIP
jgi:AraC-like DNA-binding protein